MREIEAAVMREPGTVEVETLALEDPGPNEVLVDVRATGVCHTDYHRYTGDAPAPLPIVLGHEGAGVVEAVGDGVTAVDPGDHVVLSVMPPCGTCEYCESGRPYLCQVGIEAAFEGTMLDGGHRLYDGDEPVNHFFAQSSFAERAVVPERAAVPVPEDLPFELASLLGCGATTGLGAVFNTAGVEAGASVAVFGCGGVGSSALMAASAVSAGPLVAVDVLPGKLEHARDLGATHAVNAAEDDPVERVREVTDGGVEYAFECIGKAETVEQAIGTTRPGGTAVVVGEVDAEQRIEVAPLDLLPGGRTIRGSVTGSMRPSIDIPRYARMHLRGDVDLDALLSRTAPLDDLEDAFGAMAEGEVVRSVLTQ